MSMWSSGVAVLVLCCVGYSIARNLQIQRPYFESRNFCNILRWESSQTNGTSVPILYSVEYTIYGNKWTKKWECQNMTAVSCDLTAETANILEQYHGKVTVTGTIPVQSLRFYPLRDTILGHPSVFPSPEVTSVSVTVELPKGPDKRTSLKNLLRGHPNIFLSYTVKLTPAEQLSCDQNLDHLYTNTSDHSKVEIQDLKPNMEYCGLATYSVWYDNKNKFSEPFLFRVKTHTAAVAFMSLFIIYALMVALLIVAMLAATFWIYVGRKRRTPHSLTLKGGKLLLSDTHISKENLYISRVEFCSMNPHISMTAKNTDCESRHIKREGSQARHNRGLHPPHYCNNAPPLYHSYSNQQGALVSSSNTSQSSIQYSCVVGVQHSSDSVQWFRRPSSEAVAGGNHTQPPLLLSPAHLKPGEDSQPGPLVLLTKTGPDGLLQLPGLLSLLADADSVLPPFSEGVPLLSSLVTHQEGDDEAKDSVPEEDHLVRMYLPPQENSTIKRSPFRTPNTHLNPEATQTLLPPPSYIQNWIPGAPPLAGAPGENPNWELVDPPAWPDEGGGGIFLEDWKVKIQT